MYAAAFGLLEEDKFDEAIPLFESMIESYPNGKRLPDAFYWLGETYARLDPPQWEKSRQSFVQLTRLYPDHAKVPESLLKLGTINEELGDEPKALEYFDRVVNDFPRSDAARLASQYAEAIRDAEE